MGFTPSVTAFGGASSPARGELSFALLFEGVKRTSPLAGEVARRAGGGKTCIQVLNIVEIPNIKN